MVNLTEIKITTKKYIDIECPLLVLGIYKNQRLNPQQKKLDNELQNKISHAIKLDNFRGKKDSNLIIYGNASIKRVLIVGLDSKQNYTTDIARSIASTITRYADKIKISSFALDGDFYSSGIAGPPLEDPWRGWCGPP